MIKNLSFRRMPVDVEVLCGTEMMNCLGGQTDPVKDKDNVPKPTLQSPPLRKPDLRPLF